jgi:hypothetical protein
MRGSFDPYLVVHRTGPLFAADLANKPMYVVSLSEQMKRITSEEAPRRYRSKQLQLFENCVRADREGITPEHPFAGFQWKLPGGRFTKRRPG